ncbi:hypothetical protein HU200_018658 [Digitaria exilis]|uniref:Uncharacterized protein n=1 Tax=Digitaria exilis TaxID=1010633 RepID=A0A835F4I1_9POAL|nr:hypothetical protein HU200_018658 [Digitaria exilis]
MGAPSSSVPAAAAAALVFLALVTGAHCRESQLDTGAVDAGGLAENFNTSESAVYWGPWQKARATWYGQPNGAGPDDNGERRRHCQISFRFLSTPCLSAHTHCALPWFVDLCNVAHESSASIRCTKDKSCSGKAETVIITDMNYYPVSKYHFDLSGTAFGRLAKPGLNDKLRHSGIIDIEFTRVPCEFPGLKIGFHVEEYSNPVYFAVLVEYEDGDGDVVQVDLMESKTAHGPPTGRWTPMRESWGSIWRMDTNHRMQAPFSIRIRNESGKTLVAKNVIPANWRPNTFYRSFVQYS